MKLGSLLFIFAGVVGAAAVIDKVVLEATKEIVSVTVTDKERQVKDETSKYIVFTDKEVFQNTDVTMAWKFNSSDIQGSLVKGCDYDLTVYGLRVQFMSMYRDILEAKHKPTDACPTVPQPR